MSTHQLVMALFWIAQSEIGQLATKLRAVPVLSVHYWLRWLEMESEVDLKTLRDRFGADIPFDFSTDPCELRRLQANGHMRLENGAVSITLEGSRLCGSLIRSMKNDQSDILVLAGRRFARFAINLVAPGQLTASPDQALAAACHPTHTAREDDLSGF